MNLLCLDIAHGIDASYQTYDWSALMTEEISEDHGDHFYFIRTVQKNVPIPKVLVLREFDRRPPQHVRFSRTQVFMRDAHTCQYCGKTLPKQKLNIDHVVPRIQGGKTTWDNVVTSCHFCNRVKGGRTPSQAGMHLLTRPIKPSISPLLAFLKEQNPSWSMFLL